LLIRAQTASLTADSTTLAAGGGTVSIAATITYSGRPSALGWTITLPAGWSYAGGDNPGVAPSSGQTGALDWAFTSIPASPARLTFRANYPAGQSGAATVGGSAVYREDGQLRSLSVPSLALSVGTPPPASLRPVNLSVRVQVGTGANVLITGLALGGEGTKRYLVRAAGPALGAFGLSGLLADPVITVFGSTNNQIAMNDNWEAALSSTFSAVGAFAFPAGSRDAATVLTLGAGNYTFQISGTGGTSGLALFELYEVP
jgi:hypothetical protein